MLWGRRRDNQLWSCPGGHLEPGEDPRDGAARELFEEAGLDTRPEQLKPLGVPVQSGRNLVYCYRLDLAEEAQPTAENDPDEEFAELRWVALENGRLPAEILDHLHVPIERNALLEQLGLVPVSKAESKAAPRIEGATFQIGPYYLGDESADILVSPDGAGYSIAWVDQQGPLGSTGTLSKAEAATVLFSWLEKTISDISPGKAIVPETPNSWSVHDFSHVLQPKHRKAGYQLQIAAEPSRPGRSRMVQAKVVHKGKQVGQVGAFLHPDGKFEVGTDMRSTLDPKHQGKGLGTAMYEGLFAHAYHGLGVREVHGGQHSTSASRVHESLARKHGLAYTATPDYGPESDNYQTREDWARAPTGPNDGKYLGYHYALKSEDLDKAERARDILVCIPKSRQAAIEEEERQVAEQVRAGLKGSTYWWSVHRLPKDGLPRRVFFCWDGAVRAYHECVGSVTEPDPRLLLDHVIHDVEPVPMKAFRGWRYWEHPSPLRKSEQEGLGADIQPTEIDRLLTHPDPAERSMALKLAGVRRHHLAAALASGDPVLEAAALAHPGLDEEMLGHLVAMPGRWELKRKLLAREELPGWVLVDLVSSSGLQDPAAQALLRDIARDPRAPTEALELLWRAGLYRTDVLRHPACPVQALAEVCGQALDCSGEPPPEAVLAFRHPRCPEALLLRAVRSHRPELLAAACACPDLLVALVEEVLNMRPLDVRDLLTQARVAEARQLVLSGWNVTQELAQRAAADADMELAARAGEVLARRWAKPTSSGERSVGPVPPEH